MMPAAFAALLWALAIAATLPRSEAAAMTASGGDIPLFRSIDDEFAYAASVVPGGFGGWYYDEEGRPNVYLRDMTRREEAVAALMPFLKDRHISLPGGRSTPDVDRFVIHQGQYDYRDLLRWREQITGLVGQVPGLRRMDVAEERNRVRISVEDDAAARRLRSAMITLEIPAEAVLTELLPREVEEAPVTDDSPLLPPPAQGTITLRSRAVAPTGGYRIHFAVGGGEYSTCTIGFLARWRGPPGTPATRSLRRVFVTNSHCGTRFQITGTRMFQGDLLTNRRSRTETAWFLGAETYDFEGVAGTDPGGCFRAEPRRNDGKCCPITMAPDVPVTSRNSPIRCRYSDAAVIAWNPGAGGVPRQWGFGTIARLVETYRDPMIPVPLQRPLDHQDTTLAKVTVDAANPVYRIAGEKAYTEYGELLHTVGAKTGWKQGTLRRSCFHTPTNDSQQDKLLRCQDETSIRPVGGDSGSPVFTFWRPTNPNDPLARLTPDRRRQWVYLRGILSGSMGSLSTMADVEDELGELETFDCTPENPDYPNCKTARSTRRMGRPPRFVPGSADEELYWKLGDPVPTQPTTVTPTRPER